MGKVSVIDQGETISITTGMKVIVRGTKEQIEVMRRNVEKTDRTF